MFEVFKDQYNRWWWRVVDDGAVVVQSAKCFVRKRDAADAATALQKAAGSLELVVIDGDQADEGQAAAEGSDGGN